MQSGSSTTNSSGDSISSSLLGLVKLNDPAAWRRLTALFCPVVYGWARRAGLQSSDASDVMQETFGAVAAKIISFERDHPGGSFRGWLWTITQNKIRDHHRRAAGRPQVAGGTTAHADLEQLPHDVTDATAISGGLSHNAALVRRALESIRGDFEPTSWQAFWRSAVEGQTTEQIAADLSISKSAARQAKYRVLRRLRQEIDGLLD